ncbi:MAG: aspartate-semialdehyde dehydrogenase [Thermoplasmata archaeon]|nr:aspartate-semialdehyde dehydrogenase [Thermoplasmata archaeon]
MSAERIPCALLGAGGYIGQHFLRLLAGHPEFELTALLGGRRTATRRVEELWSLEGEAPAEFARRRIGIASPTRLSRSGERVVFSALPSGTAGAIESELLRRGISVFTNAADHREDARTSLLLPEVNGERFRRRRSRTPLLLANPNCTATGLALALAPVSSLLRPQLVVVSSYQALSGAGLDGLTRLRSPPNVIPFIEGEEPKVMRETRRLLGPALGRSALEANCARVPVRDGHLEAVLVKAAGRPSTPELFRGWSRFKPLADWECPSAPDAPVVVRMEEDRPQPLLDLWAGTPVRARGMAVTVGRVRWEPPYLRFFLLLHNAVRGGAGGSVLNAEYALARGWLAHGS